jgi:hypothetical protein
MFHGHGCKHGVTGDSGESIAKVSGTCDVMGMGCSTYFECMINALSIRSHVHTQLIRCKTRASIESKAHREQGRSHTSPTAMGCIRPLRFCTATSRLANIAGMSCIEPLKILFSNVKALSRYFDSVCNPSERGRRLVRSCEPLMNMSNAVRLVP